MSDFGLFWREFRNNFRTTGAVLPSGRRLSQALARFVAEPSDAPRRILEVGPGTGAVTQYIAAAMREADRLDLVEVNEQFVHCLRDKLQADTILHAVSDRTCIIHASLEKLAVDTNYDLIVSGLPLNNFSVAEAESIFEALDRLAADGAVLSFFEYIGIRRVKGLISSPSERARLRGIGELLANRFAAGEIRREAVWGNVPPAWVHHIRLSSL